MSVVQSRKELGRVKVFGQEGGTCEGLREGEVVGGGVGVGIVKLQMRP